MKLHTSQTLHKEEYETERPYLHSLTIGIIRISTGNGCQPLAWNGKITEWQREQWEGGDIWGSDRAGEAKNSPEQELSMFHQPHGRNTKTRASPEI